MKIKYIYSKPLKAIAIVLILVLSLVACGTKPPIDNGNDNANDILVENSGEPIDVVSDTVKNMIFQVIDVEISWAKDLYLAEDEPAQPQHEDLRLDKITYKGHVYFAETAAAVFLVETSNYDKSWHEYPPFYVIIERTAGDDGWLAVLDVSYDTFTDRTIEAIVLEAAYGLWDIDVSVIFDGFTEYVGPGSSYIFLNEDHDTEFHFDYEPVYSEGDYWLSYYYEGLTATCYHNADEGRSIIMSLEATRPDAQTYRGIRVGSTREEVFAAYPNIIDGSYWGWEGDYVWHNKHDDGYELGYGVSTLFWFVDDLVSKIEMINMFD